MDLPPIPALVRGEPHVWRCSLDLDEQRLRQAAAILDAAERARAARFHFDRHRNAFIAARGSLRIILGAYLDLAPADITLAYGAYGKPLLEPSRHHSTLCFNLAHTQYQMVLALTAGQAVGIDCEEMVAERDLGLIAQGVFSAAEQAWWIRLKGDEAVLGFYRCWTRKEAYIKAHGLGLSMPLQSFDVSLDAAARLLATRPDATLAQRWSMEHIELDAGYVGAIVVEGPLRQLHYLR